MTEEIKLQEDNHSNRLTLSEVKDCGYARLCRRSLLTVLLYLVLFAGLIVLSYFVLRNEDSPKARLLLYLILLYSPFIIYSVTHDAKGLRRLYSNYENFELVTCEIWNVSSLDYGFQTQERNFRRVVTHNLTFTTSDGAEHKLTSQKVKKSSFFAVFQLDRYNGSAQFLYDAQNDVLYPFTPLPPKVKKK